MPESASSIPRRRAGAELQELLGAGDHFFGPSMVPSTGPQALDQALGTALGAVQESPYRTRCPIPQRSAWQRPGTVRCRTAEAAAASVTPADWIDPLAASSPRSRVAVGYAKVLVGHSDRHIEQAVGYRRARDQEPAAKVNWVHPGTTGGRLEPPTVEPGRMQRSPPTPLMREAEERLRSRGLGSPLEVCRASDEAIFDVFAACAFSRTECMALLWELRRSSTPSPRPGPGTTLH